ncbi:MAG: hypothetical protein RQ715_02765 [Methylococcales bacterium]|nr:hypothetical protein [Methylococcales bacterium]
MARKRNNKPAPRNWVAKHAAQLQRAQVFDDKTRYHRHDKHKRQPEPP